MDQPESMQPLSVAAKLFQVADSALLGSITTKTMRMRGQDDITITLSSQEAANSRDALGKFVYEKLFDW